MMKKQKFAIRFLKLEKVSVAKLNAVQGAAKQTSVEETLKTYCCSVYPYCLPTLTTRPDSLNPGPQPVDLTLNK